MDERGTDTSGHAELGSQREDGGVWMLSYRRAPQKPRDCQRERETEKFMSFFLRSARAQSNRIGI
jgi:hypothetical protein